MKLKPLSLLLGLLVVSVGFFGAACSVIQTPETAVTGQNLAASDADAVVCIGYVDLENGVRLLAPLRPGRVAKVLVREGQTVANGDPLIQLEDGDARDSLAEADAALAAAQAQQATARQGVQQHQFRLKQQEAAIEVSAARLAAARLLAERKEELFQTKLINDKELGIAREQVKEADAADQAERAKLAELKQVDPKLVVQQADAEVGIAQARRQRAERGVEECTLKAPSNGLVQRVLTGPGDLASGNPQQPLIQFCPAEPRLVRAEVDQEFTDRVSVGQPALLRDDARPGVQWHGKVLRVADWYAQRRPNPQDPSAFLDVRTIECLIEVEPGPEALRIGQRLRVRIEPSQATAKK